MSISTTRKILFGILLLAATFLVVGSSRLAHSAESILGFDGDETSWHITRKQSDVRLFAHRRNKRIFVKGSASENIELEALFQGAPIQFEHDLPPARVIDDLKLSVSVRSNRPGLVVGLRIIFPHHKDPRTGGVLSTVIAGDDYKTVGRWQELNCSVPEKQIRERIVLLRAQLNAPQIDLRDLFVDRVVLTGRLPRGTSEFFIDELKFGPIVSPDEPITVEQTSAEQEKDEMAAAFRLDRLTLHGRPWFPTLTTYHGDDASMLAKAGFRLVWIPDYQDVGLLDELRRHDLWAVATPPRAAANEGDFLDSKTASLIPFTAKTRPILAWYLGTRIPESARYELVSWIEQIRAADRRFGRPLLGDVTGDERVFSRHLGMTGLSKHVINTNFSLEQYRDWLHQRRRIARPGSFVWTWIQTEPSTATRSWRIAANRSPVVIEPEQIRLQLYAALAAGCRGIAYWMTTPLDDENPGARERRLTVTQLNLELSVMEEWLASGTLVGSVPVNIESYLQSKSSRPTNINSDLEREKRRRNEFLSQNRIAGSSSSRTNTEVNAAMIRSDAGLLLLPMWYQKDAQFVPGQMAASQASIVVPGVDESAAAWEVTTTSVRSLARERVTGGLRITIPKFDQTAMIVLTANRESVDVLRRKTNEIKNQSATVSLELATAKLERVKTIDLELTELGVGLPDGRRILERSTSLLQLANTSLEQGDFHSARELSTYAMQLTRISQRSHWQNAVGKLSSPTSSLHTVSFQTLPDHWRMVQALGRSPTNIRDDNLRSGDFEDIDTMVAAGWEHKQIDIEGVHATAELHPNSKEGRYSLRLVAIPDLNSNAPAVIDEVPVSVTTPPISVQKGQIVHVTGWVRVASPIQSNLDGAMLYENLTGKVGALRWREDQEWTRFELIREVPRSSEFRVTISLNGLGEVHFDDLKITTHDTEEELASDSEARDGDSQPESGRGALDFLQRLPKLRPLRTR